MHSWKYTSCYRPNPTFEYLISSGVCFCVILYIYRTHILHFCYFTALGIKFWSFETAGTKTRCWRARPVTKPSTHPLEKTIWYYTSIESWQLRLEQEVKVTLAYRAVALLKVFEKFIPSTSSPLLVLFEIRFLCARQNSTPLCTFWLVLCDLYQRLLWILHNWNLILSHCG